MHAAAAAVKNRMKTAVQCGAPPSAWGEQVSAKDDPYLQVFFALFVFIVVM